MTISDAVKLLEQNDDYLILTHRRPDGDTIGSAAALCHALRRIGKTAYLCPNPEITEKYMPFAEPYLAKNGFEHSFVISTDVASEKLFPIGAPEKADLCIDHHPSNTGYAARTLVWGDRSSNGEIVLEIIKELCGGIDNEEADLLYVAVSTDTGCFAYGNTNANTFRAAAELSAAGAAVAKLNKILFRTATKARMLLEGYMLSSLKSYFDDRLNIVTVTLDMMERSGATENDCDDIASIAGRVKGNVVGVTIRELEPGLCKISVRSTEAVDASAICAKFNGGGHKMAAGCEISETPEKCAELIFEAVSEVMT